MAKTVIKSFVKAYLNKSTFLVILRTGDDTHMCGLSLPENHPVGLSRPLYHNGRFRTQSHSLGNKMVH